MSADRHPRTIPTANTMVSASTASTEEAKNDVATTGPVCSQSIISPRTKNLVVKEAHFTLLGGETNAG
jgi:hypothetical protein